jgi:hypothetical protein
VPIVIYPEIYEFDLTAFSDGIVSLWWAYFIFQGFRAGNPIKAGLSRVFGSIRSSEILATLAREIALNTKRRFNANLLIGELERNANGRDKGLLWDLHDIFTRKSFLIAGVAALIGYVLVERLRDGSRYTWSKR